ncbi:hypothetical protein, partial [Lacticaseibacillus paracasei]|uniref:hypothetical protein n=1 Tax=Lacticaseibacillus paracasei TaxID=1597 RepID=UPI00177E4E2A
RVRWVINPRLSRGVTLAVETENAAKLINTAIGLLSAPPSGPVDADPVFACLSLGMEKILKLSIGLDGLARTGRWPSKHTMRATYGHQIEKLDGTARQAIRDHAEDASAKSYVLAALAECDADPVITSILSAMQRYAVDGRFHNLDHLATDQPGESTPLQLWMEIQHAVLSNPAAMHQLHEEADGPFRWPRTVTTAVECSIRGWVEMYARAWRQGVFGPDARQVAASLAVGPRS